MTWLYHLITWLKKMVEKDLLQPIDYSKLTNYDQVNNPYMPAVLGIQNDMFEGNEMYGVPYFWGTFGLMYNKDKPGLTEAINTHGWGAYFESGKRPVGTKVGMYNTPRYAYAAALLYQGISPNLYNDETLSLVEDTLSSVNFSEWGFDTLKKGIVSKKFRYGFFYIQVIF